MAKQQKQPKRNLVDASLRSHLSSPDRMGDVAYVADCIAQNYTAILPWEALSETERQRYRAIAEAVQRDVFAHNNQYDYNALHDPDADDQHNYHAVHLHNYAACAACGSPTQEACVLCEKPFDTHCLHNIHLPEMYEENPAMVDTEWGPERAEPDYEYTRVCLACFIEHEKHPPYSWGWPNHRLFAYAAPRGVAAIRQGIMIPAGDLDAWVSDPGAAKLIKCNYQSDVQGINWPRDLDAFQSLSLLAWITAWQSEIKTVADPASAALVKYHNKSLENAREADRGYIDYSQFE